MGLGVLDDQHLEHVPGTALLTDIDPTHTDAHHHRDAHYDGLDTSRLQHAQGRHDADVVLVPQPSSSPDDPLNWSLWRKDLILFFICIDTAVVGAWGPMISPAYAELAAQWNMSYNKFNGGMGWGVFVIGISCFFTNAMAVVWGRRPVYLLGNLMLFAGSLIGYFAHSYSMLMAARIIGCIGMSPFEVLVTSTIADLYFVHQRGLRLAMWGLCLSIGVGSGTIISGYIIEDAGWNWTYGVSAIIFGVWTIVLFFFCPETAYHRDVLLETDLGTQDATITYVKGQLVEESVTRVPGQSTNVETSTEKTSETLTATAAPGTRTTSVAATAVDDNNPSASTRRPYLYDLRIYRGRQCPDAYWKVLVRPLMMLVFPQVLFSFLAYGLTTSWLVVIASVLSMIFSAPPYNFKVASIGLLSISTLIGSIAGAFTSGPLADWITKAMSRRNGGVYEPEFRLVIIVVCLVLGGMSFFGFGWSLSVEDAWIVPVVFYGLQYFSVSFMNIAVYGYLTDCHRNKAPEAFAAINLRNIYSFGLHYFISSWITTQGPKQVFCIVGGIHVFICLSAIPMYVFGKRCRSWTSRVRIFQKVMES